jgi:hypothetical protein
VYVKFNKGSECVGKKPSTNALNIYQTPVSHLLSIYEDSRGYMICSGHVRVHNSFHEHTECH